jgi:DNA primase
MAVDVIKALGEKLPDYLREMGITLNSSSLGRCPIHDDTGPSFHVSGSMWHCFGCGMGGNIYHLVAFLEGLPEPGGPGFMETTVQTLADRYGIPYSAPKGRRLSLSQQIKGVYRLIAQNLTVEGYEDLLAKRGYTPKIAKRYGMGWVFEYEKLLTSAEAQYGKQAVWKAGLRNAELYNNERLMFTLRDYNGVPIAFSGRTTEKSKGEDLSKYINSPNNEVFNKGRTFYNLSRAKHYDVLYMMEGQTDTVTSCISGLPNTIGVLSNNVTDGQIEVLKAFDKVVIAFDGDKGGVSKATKLLALLPNATAILIPKESDPDEYIREKGIEAFLNLEEWDLFGWELINGKYRNRQQMVEACRLIAKANPLLKPRYIAALAYMTEISKEEIVMSVHKEEQLYQRQRLQVLLQTIGEADASAISLGITVNVNETE